jgi:hypothetical protein
LPIPGSPEIRKQLPRPASDCSRAPRNSESSRVRPMNAFCWPPVSAVSSFSPCFRVPIRVPALSGNSWERQRNRIALHGLIQKQC